MSKRLHVSSTEVGCTSLEVGGGGTTPSSTTGSSQPPPSKRPYLAGSDPVSFSRVRSLEELDKRTLQLQNKKLLESLNEKRSAISDLRQRIEQLENRQAKDDALLCVVNRYWNQLDEDCLLLLQRCDVDVDEEVSPSAESFLKQLASWEKEEVQEKLQERVHFSKRIVARLLTGLERLVAQRTRLRSLLADKLTPLCSADKPWETDSDRTDSSPHLQLECQHVEDGGEQETNKSVVNVAIFTTLKEEVMTLTTENARLHSQYTSMHAKHRQSALHVRELQDRCQTRSDAADEWQAKYEDLEYKNNQSTSQLARLDHRLFETQQAKKLLEEELAALRGTGSPADLEDSVSGGTGLGVTKSKYNDIFCELEEQRELATNRLSELERLQRQHEEKVAECARLSMELSDPPEALIQESPSYKSLKVQFNILFNEVKMLRTQLDEARTMAQTIRHSHLKQIEEMEANEAAIINQTRAEMLAQEELYSQLRRDFEAIEADLKQTVAHNEQAGPINSEMRSLISTLQQQNKQLKAEIVRYRRKSKEAMQDCDMVSNDLRSSEDELSKVRASLSEATAAVIHLTDKLASATILAAMAASKTSSPIVAMTATTSPCLVSSSPPVIKQISTGDALSPPETKKASEERPMELVEESVRSPDDSTVSEKKTKHQQARQPSRPTPPPPPPPPPTFDTNSIKLESSSRDRRASTSSATPEETIRELRAQLKHSQEAQKEMSVLLNMYKVIPKDQRDKATLLQAEAKLRAELSESRGELSQLQTILSEQQHRMIQLQKRIAAESAVTAAASGGNNTPTECNSMSVQVSGSLMNKKESISPQLQQLTSFDVSVHPNLATMTPPVNTTCVLPVSPSATKVSPASLSLGASPASYSCDATSTNTTAAAAVPATSSALFATVAVTAAATANMAVAAAQSLEAEKRVWQVAELQQELQHVQRRCNSLEKEVGRLQAHLTTARQQEDVMLKEMEVTGQAFEDVQEQNVRLLKSLQEKDDANLNQMTEWMKTSQLARLLKEDKKLLDEQVKLMQAQIEALNRAIQKQEDKERLLLTNVGTLEKEASARQQSQEAYKRKAIECQQREEDLLVTVAKYLGQLKEAQTMVQEKASAYEQVSFRHQRLQEELVTLRRKYERLRKIEQSHNADEVLLAEIQDYKEQLTCPACKTNKKDAILTKCFHVFCLNCLQTRYETRNRKCPKCNATFGANDYHRIYLT